MQDIKNDVAQLKQSAHHHRVAFYGIFVVLVIVSISVIILLKFVLSSTPTTSARGYVMPTFAPVSPYPTTTVEISPRPSPTSSQNPFNQTSGYTNPFNNIE